MQRQHIEGMKRLALCAALTVILGSCGGNGGDSQISASGVAAVGAPIVSGVVSLNCASGATPSTTTDQEGNWTVHMKPNDFPCAVKVSGGKRRSPDGSETAAPTLYSVAEKSGTTNITPITNMVVAVLSQLTTGSYDTEAWYSVSNRERLQAAMNQLAESKKKVLDTLETMPGKLDPTAGVDPTKPIDPITSKFNANESDAIDRLLEQLQASMAALVAMGMNQQSVLEAAVNNQPVTQKPAYATAYTYPALTSMHAVAAQKQDSSEYYITIPDPLRGNKTARVTGFDADGNAADLAETDAAGNPSDFNRIVSFAGNRVGILCVDKQGHMTEDRKSLYGYVSSDVTKVTDVTELYGKTFSEYEDCMTPSGTLVVASTGEATFTDVFDESDPVDSAEHFRAIFSDEGAEDGNAKAFGKAYKYTYNGVTKYFYLVVSSETPFDDDDVEQENYVILGVSN